MDGKNSCLLIHYRLDDIVPGERRFAVEGLAAYWAACVMTLYNPSVPRSMKHSRRHAHVYQPNHINKLRTLCDHTEWDISLGLYVELRRDPLA